LSCNSTSEECQIKNAFSGLCQGNWFLFENINELNKKSLNLFIEISSKLYQTIQNKKQTFEHLNQSYQLIDSKELNFFTNVSRSTTFDYSNVWSDVQLDQRIVSLTKPDYNQVLLCNLIQSGFQHASQLTNLFLNFIRYTVQFALTENISQHGRKTKQKK